MEADELWMASYRGEMLGEVLFTLLAEREADPDRRRDLEALALLERSTKELAEPILERRGIGPVDAQSAVAAGTAMAEGAAKLPWAEFLGFFQPEISEFLNKYRRLVALAADDRERDVARAYVAHEQALEAFLRRSLGQEDGDPLEPIFSLPHVAVNRP